MLFVGRPVAGNVECRCASCMLRELLREHELLARRREDRD
jgi:hypothetical protein